MPAAQIAFTKNVNKALGTKHNIEKNRTYCTDQRALVCVGNSKQELALMDIWTLQLCLNGGDDLLH